jgi:hypothetical protein
MPNASSSDFSKGSTDSARELDNRLMWRGQPGHYEVFYLTATHRPSRTGYWIRYTLESPIAGHGQPYVQLWFCRGDAKDPNKTFAINRRFPISALAHTQSPFTLRIGEAELTHSSMRGSLSGHGHDVRWELRWKPAPKTHLFLPKNLYTRDFAETLVLSPNLSVELHGSIEIDGERLEFGGEPAGQTHLWGRKHAYAWAWGHCNSFVKDGGSGESGSASRAVLETLSVIMRRGPVVLPLTLFTVYPEGLSGEPLRFTEWLSLPFCRSEYRTGHYSLSGENTAYRVEAVFSCQADDMVRAQYVDPDGAPAYCHFTATGSCKMTISRRPFPGTKWTVSEELRSENGAQFEWGGRVGDSLVKKRHLLIEES